MPSLQLSSLTTQPLVARAGNHCRQEFWDAARPALDSAQPKVSRRRLPNPQRPGMARPLSSTGQASGLSGEACLPLSGACDGCEEMPRERASLSVGLDAERNLAAVFAHRAAAPTPSRPFQALNHCSPKLGRLHTR